jgi:hypothetical protein
MVDGVVDHNRLRAQGENNPRGTVRAEPAQRTKQWM